MKFGLHWKEGNNDNNIKCHKDYKPKPCHIHKKSKKVSFLVNNNNFTQISTEDWLRNDIITIIKCSDSEKDGCSRSKIENELHNTSIEKIFNVIKSLQQEKISQETPDNYYKMCE